MANRSANGLYSTDLTYTKRILLMVCVFVFMMAMATFASLLAGYFADPGTRAFLLWTATFQNIIGFAGTAVVCAIFLSKRPLEMLGVNRAGTWLALGGILLIYALGQPFLNQVIWWNSQLHLPDTLQTVEQTMRQWEEQAMTQTDTLISGKSVTTLLLNVLVIGIITGTCEELVFRGTLQRILASGPIGSHAAIWITAIIFSIMHFQFFGFLPRVLLGAFFGYLFYRTGSIWMSAAAHAINNSMYVIVAWLINNGVHVGSIDTFGVTHRGFPAVACTSLFLVLFVFIGLRTYLFKTHG